MGSKNSNSTYSDWLDTQRQYFDAWTAFGQLITNTLNGELGEKNPMADSMQQWWRLIAPTLPVGSNDLITKLAEQSKLFFFMGEQFATLLNNVKEFKKISGDWQSVLNKQFEEMKKLLASSINSNHTMHGLCGAWQLLPLDTLQRTFASASVMPGDFLEDLKPENLEKVTDRFLSIPGVGYTRESQEQVQKGIKLWNQYQKAGNEFNNAMCNVGISALDAMRLKIIEMAEQGKEINSLREVYDVWVDCNEEAYARFVISDEYSELNGRLTNALMAVKQHGRNIVDEALGAMNMPTRRGINTMQKRQQEMRREQKDANNKIEYLQQEIGLLREQIAGNYKSLSESASPARTRTRRAKEVTRKIPDHSSSPKNAKKEKAGAKRKAKKGNKSKKEGSKKDDMIVIKI
jgi:polyhydroxyalkanoate synthase subunit PhaE